MRKLTVGLAAVCIAVATTLLLSTDAQTKEEPKPGSEKSKTTRTVARPRATPAAEETPLGKTIRLKFTLTNDDGDHSFPVLCAARTFLIEHDVSEADGGQQMKIAGQVRALDKPDCVFVAFNLMHYHRNENASFEANFKLEGSAILRLDKKTEAGNLGEQKVSITASLVE